PRAAIGAHTRCESGSGRYRTDITEEQLRGAPAFSRDRNFDWSDRAREEELHQYYASLLGRMTEGLNNPATSDSVERTRLQETRDRRRKFKLRHYRWRDTLAKGAKRRLG